MLQNCLTLFWQKLHSKKISKLVRDRMSWEIQKNAFFAASHKATVFPCWTLFHACNLVCFWFTSNPTFSGCTWNLSRVWNLSNWVSGGRINTKMCLFGSLRVLGKQANSTVVASSVNAAVKVSPKGASSSLATLLTQGPRLYGIVLEGGITKAFIF